MFIEKMKGQDYIAQIRKYLDYLEEHLENVRKAFQEVSEKCDGMIWVGDDFTWHTLRQEVMNHDLSKFSKEEFIQYRAMFYKDKNELFYTEEDFKEAWENHKNENHHHWETIELGIDVEKHPGLVENNIIHMIIDWTAMGYKFGDTAQTYYEANKKTIKINERWIPFIYEVFNRLKK